jgi:AFG3 family protein
MTSRFHTLRQLQKRFNHRYYDPSSTPSLILERRQSICLKRWSSNDHSSYSPILARWARDSDATLTVIPYETLLREGQQVDRLTLQHQLDSRLSWFNENSIFHRNNNNNTNHLGFPSPLEDLKALLPSWLAVKIPKGFENFFPKNKQRNPNEHEEPIPPKEVTPDASTSADSSKKSDSTKMHATFKTKQDEKWKRNKGGVPPPEENDPQNIPAMIALLLIVVAARRFFSDENGISNVRNGKEITFVDFRNYLLDSGQVEKIVVVNNNLARVILHPGSKGIPAHVASSSLSSSTMIMDNSIQHKHDGEPDNTVLEFNRPEGSSDSSVPAMPVLSTAVSTTAAAANTPVYHFYIGTVESFEDKLSKAQSNIHPREWVPVQYVNEVNLLVEFIKATPMLALVAILFYYSRVFLGGAGASSGGGIGNIFQVGKSNAKKINPQSVKVSFKDVAGCQQAKAEVMEFVQFLSSPEQFTKLGAKIPKGALLCGPPGTGKTLLAKAVAGEAGVPFYSISGSDFIEMFVGVGPSRVRDLFKEARGNSPCIIFIDEIDAVGRQRGRGGFSGGNDERENTLNQLLVEMDGFNPTTGVVVLAGTNRVDILDQALTRPGRFDRQITVDRPDLQGRKEIFNVHLKGITLEGGKEDYAGRLAGLTPGFVGADIANLCNEAAIVAARRKGDSVAFQDFEKATDRIIGGLESNKIMSDHEKKIVAYHEAGHAVAGWFLEHADPLLKVTIIPRSSGALGFAQYLPKETFLRTQEQILDMVCKALAGRAAEDVFFGRVTTGASDDLKRVTQLVYSTIQTFGMNSRVGQLAYPKNDNGLPGDKPYSDSTAEAMDEEARAIVDAAYARTVELIIQHKDEVEKVAKLLLEKETITHDDIVDLIGDRPFKGDAQYEEYISRRDELKRAAAAEKSDTDGSSKESDVTETLDAGSNQGGLTPGLA